MIPLTSTKPIVNSTNSTPYLHLRPRPLLRDWAMAGLDNTDASPLFVAADSSAVQYSKSCALHALDAGECDPWIGFGSQRELAGAIYAATLQVLNSAGGPSGGNFKSVYLVGRKARTLTNRYHLVRPRRNKQ